LAETFARRHTNRYIVVQEKIVNTLSEINPVVSTHPTAFEAELAELIVASLHLEITAAEIEPTAPLFGEGLGLDSIDALELALAISRQYGLELKSDDERNGTIFSDLRNLAAYIGAHRTK
jgi:acyl carrier protein